MFPIYPSPGRRPGLGYEKLEERECGCETEGVEFSWSVCMSPNSSQVHGPFCPKFSGILGHHNGSAYFKIQPDPSKYVKVSLIVIFVSIQKKHKILQKSRANTRYSFKSHFQDSNYLKYFGQVAWVFWTKLILFTIHCPTIYIYISTFKFCNIFGKIVSHTQRWGQGLGLGVWWVTFLLFSFVAHHIYLIQ